MTDLLRHSIYAIILYDTILEVLVPSQRPADMVDRETEWRQLSGFAASGELTASLGLVWGRRRIGKSFLLQDLADRMGGFYYHAIRGSSAEALRDLGEHLGRHQQTAAPLSLGSWDDAVHALMKLGSETKALVVLDEFPYLLEHTPSLDSILQRAYAPRSPLRQGTQTRLLLCGSAMSVMGELLTGSAPLRGRTALALKMLPFDFRTARQLYGIDDYATALLTYATIGGVPAYACEMVSDDLPSSPDDFGRWVCERVLSPSMPLFGEVDLLFGEDPTLTRARKPNLYHSTLAGVALGHHSWSSLTSFVKTSGATLTSMVRALESAEFIRGVQDPIRGNRPLYQPADPLLRFHYAIIRPHQARLRRHGADLRALWREMEPTFRSRVLGPCFESMAMSWVRHFANPATLGGSPAHVGRTVLSASSRAGGGQAQELDVVVAADDAAAPDGRTVRALGEAKVGERMTMRHVRKLEEARTALGALASSAKLLLFGSSFDKSVRAAASAREDLELIDHERLYTGE